MEDNPVIILVLIAVSGYIVKLWLDDLRSQRRGTPNPRALPGAHPASRSAITLAVIGSALLLAAETFGETALGISGEQKKITVLFGIYTLLAAFVEEIIFRGYIVVEGRGAAIRNSAVVGASLLFALLHPHLWEWKDGALSWHFTTKAWFTTAVLFLSSLWFYFLRFTRLNPLHSLIPCFAAHLTKNVGVLVVKAVQGHISGLY